MAKRKKGVKMTWDQMVSRFNSEWVLINKPKTDKYEQVSGGEVLYHGLDRRRAYEIAKDLKLKHIAVFYTGKLVPDGMEVLI